MTLECLDPTRCTPSDFLSMCPNCMLNLEKLAIMNAANMGVPDYFYCGECGQKCDADKFAEHVYDHGVRPTFTPEQEVFIENFLDENKDLMDDLAKDG